MAEPDAIADDGTNTAENDSVVVRIGMTLREIEQLVIAATLKQTHRNISKCARILGIDRTTVYSKIRPKENSRP